MTILLISTLLLLSQSTIIGIVWPDTKPVKGTDTVSDSGPDLQQKQQNVLLRASLWGSWN